MATTKNLPKCSRIWVIETATSRVIQSEYNLLKLKKKIKKNNVFFVDVKIWTLQSCCSHSSDQ